MYESKNQSTTIEQAQQNVFIAKPNPRGFYGETVVMTDIGYREIGNIGVGSLVLSRCEITGEVAYKKVTQVIVTEDVLTYDLDYKVDGHLLFNQLTTTANHPFWVEGKGWLEAGQLQKSDRLVLHDGSYASFEKLEYDMENTVFILEIEDFHTYFVGYGGVWVSSQCKTSLANEAKESKLAKHQHDT